MTRETRLERFRHLPRLDARAEILPANQADVWTRLGEVAATFVLYGGTGLALHLGHRTSADFDFFSATPFVPTDLLEELAWLGPVAINEASPNQLVVTTRRQRSCHNEGRQAGNHHLGNASPSGHAPTSSGCLS